MAKRELQYKPTATRLKSVPARRRAVHVDWNSVFDGRVHKMTMGVHFSMPTESARCHIYSMARSRKKQVTTAVDGDDIYFQSIGDAC